MANQIVIDEGNYPLVRPTKVFLTHAHFNDPFGSDSIPERSAFLVDLALSRISVLELSVAITVSTSEEAPYQLSVTYAVDFSMHPELPEERRDSTWRYAAYHLAPGLLYPYIREAFTNLTGRSRLGVDILPFLPIPLDVPDEDQDIPVPPPESEYQGALSLDLALEAESEADHDGATVQAI